MSLSSLHHTEATHTWHDGAASRAWPETGRDRFDSAYCLWYSTKSSAVGLTSREGRHRLPSRWKRVRPGRAQRSFEILACVKRQMSRDTR